MYIGYIYRMLLKEQDNCYQADLKGCVLRQAENVAFHQDIIFMLQTIYIGIPVIMRDTLARVWFVSPPHCVWATSIFLEKDLDRVYDSYSDRYCSIL